MESFCFSAAEHVAVDLVLLVCSMFSLTWPGKAAGAESADSFCHCQLKAPVYNVVTKTGVFFFFVGECAIFTSLPFPSSLTLASDCDTKIFC